MGSIQVNTQPVTVDIVLQFMRQLPLRERLHVMAQALPELEQELSILPLSEDFWRSVDVRALAERQGVRPVDDFGALLGGWPADEVVDDFIAARREWRRHNLVMMDMG